MAEHNTSSQHPIGLSFSDGSYWCYSCDNYVDSPILRKARVALSNSKFAQPQKKEEKKEEKEEEVDEETKLLTEELNKMAIKEARK